MSGTAQGLPWSLPNNLAWGKWVVGRLSWKYWPQQQLRRKDFLKPSFGQPECRSNVGALQSL
jgi:hypothetical protein